MNSLVPCPCVEGGYYGLHGVFAFAESGTSALSLMSKWCSLVYIVDAAKGSKTVILESLQGMRSAEVVSKVMMFLGMSSFSLRRGLRQVLG